MMRMADELEALEAQDQHSTPKSTGIPHRCDMCGGLIKPLRGGNDLAPCRCIRARPRFKRQY